MGRRLNMVFLAAIAIAAMLQSSSAQTVYVVGDTLGWVVPSGPTVYSTWAANKTFRVGDTLGFNFLTGSHNVAKVSRANFNTCNSTNPLLLLSTGPVNVTLNETGDQYFLCGVPGHCSAGQNLAINVSAAASSPAPQPSTPAPQPSSPAPRPSTPAPQPSSPAPQPVTPSPASSPQLSPPAPAPQAGSPTPTPSPSPSTANPPSSSTSPPPPTGIAPSAPSPGGDNGATPPPSPVSSTTSLGVAGLSATFLPLIVAFFM